MTQKFSTGHNDNPVTRSWGSIGDAAEHRTVSVKTIRRMIARGEIYAERFGPRLIRVDMNSLDNAGRALQYVAGAI